MDCSNSIPFKEAVLRQSLLVFVPVIGLLIGSAAAPSTTAARAETPAPGRQCFFQQQVDNFRTSSGGTAVYLKVRGQGVYQLSAAGDCSDLYNTPQMAITPAAGTGFSRLCTDDWVNLSAPARAGAAQGCRAVIEKKLTDAEIAALPASDRP